MSNGVHQEHGRAAIWAEGAAHIVAFVGLADEPFGLPLGDFEVIRFHADRCQIGAARRLLAIPAMAIAHVAHPAINLISHACRTDSRR